MKKVELIVVQGKPEGKRIPLTVPSFKIGRAETCRLRPNSPEVSREHAEFVLTEESVSVRDLGSRNGTRVNGKLLTQLAALRNGDLVQVGPLTFAVAIEGVATGKAAAPGAQPSLDDVGQDQIDSWLVADESSPTPERPSGVYQGDTLTFEAYKDQAKETKDVPPAVDVPPTAPPEPSPPASAAPPEPSPPASAPPAADPLGDMEFERLPEGDAVSEDEASAEDEEVSEYEMPEEFIDESNPFYAAKKAEEQESSKPSYKDSSDAASDILRKMLERRRASKSS